MARDALLGRVLEGRFRVESLIGRAHGGGVVYRGLDGSNGAPVVIRCPAAARDLDFDGLEKALDVFKTEAAKLRALTEASSDVERTLASGIADGGGASVIPYCVFQWLRGTSLERFLRVRGGDGSSIGEAMRILEPAARALIAAHELGAVHGDVRPQNLWVAEVDGRTAVKVTSFDMAARLAVETPAYAPQYGAPEHFKRSYGAISPATDVFGFALCLVEMVSGERALEGDDEAELYLATSDLAERPTLRALGVEVSDAVEAVIARALAVDPKRRWSDMKEMWSALLAAVPEMAPATPRIITREGVEPAELPPGAVPPPTPRAVTEDARLASSAAAGTPSGATDVIRAPRRERSGLVAWILVVLGAAAAVAYIVWTLRRAHHG